MGLIISWLSCLSDTLGYLVTTYPAYILALSVVCTVGGLVRSLL